MNFKFLLLTSATIIAAATLSAQNRQRNPQQQQQPQLQQQRATTVTVRDTAAARQGRDTVVGPLSTTHHQVTVDGKQIGYTAKAGYMPIKDANDKQIARIFYVAYTKDGESNGKRPVTFVFNGGPGSAAIWLHMGAFSPIRATFADEKGNAPAPPYQYGENPYTWLGFTDLVYIDPVSTGYSRPEKGVDGSQFHGYTEDIASVGEFIRLYITKNERWDSPKFIAGESYGTTRAAGLSGYLQDKGMFLNGIMLISSVLNFQLVDFNQGNEMPYVYFFPTYAATAQYHKKLSPALQNLSTDALVKKAEIFAKGTYAYFLSEGNKASAELTNKVVDSINYFTGVPKEYIRQVNERISDTRFFKEVLRSDGKIVGRYDSRFIGEDRDDAGDRSSYDPSDINLDGIIISTFNTYVRKDLHFRSDLSYDATANVRPWNYRLATNSYLDVSETLRAAMTKNPHLKVNICCGYYDLATPLFNAEYVASHLGLRPDLQKNLSLTYYKGGHMVYVSNDGDAKLKADAEQFYRNALK